ncbi:MAG: aldehyde ferredoxin oxidoreductase family protein [Deltaproteobacteria bacterium]|nr:aldehyde ferredoxin oxidoreductase family protein [Deltaproteobacteria bacterium]MBW2050161.1 aldehyde ferredoxin oxidoreductase family protein [Deltaproteobacteria bacterium]MBW2111172.1 aldehyde ferredoxin oxidoreductase family protein [Deltaproteobacteria bacterium]MBW2353627.1 aldehyde ferredoxin oxidoreductase family protein [Deltaproteobacteria bacterium]HDZ89330.1 ABC transporter ATP-binding protein [Deltaproteobacteria bacterium]
MYKGGYTGKILRVNLTEQTVKEEALSQDVARDFIGGAGFGIKFLFDEVKGATDPLGPDNKLIFASGPFSGTTIPCASRMAVTSKSPLTGAVGMALTGGYFPVELKFAGWDALIIEGKAKEPTYVWIKDGEVKFRSAKKLWGMKTTDTQQIIKNELHDQNIRVACIGPAGENQIKIASIINEWRAIGRKGLGAVMGSKNLKAIAIRGTGEVAVADKDKLKAAKGEMTKAMKESHVLYPAFAKIGTPMVVDHTCATGIFPTKNFMATGEYNPVDKIGVDVQMTRNVGFEACYGCPVGCSQLKLAKTGPYAGILTEGPEFETMYAYGGVTGVENIDAIIAADRMADELGFDTLSSGVTIAFAMELFEKGILTKEDTGGLELNFGNHEAMNTVLKLMAYREGIGDLLADGSKAAAEKIGKGADKYAMHVKGLELPAYDVRGAKAHGLNYATSYTGADHCRGYAFQEIFGIPVPHEVDRFTADGKGKLTKWNQDIRTATTDAPTMCAFLLDMAVVGIAAQNTASLMEAVTGFTYTPDDILQVGERINNLAHAFNVREGFTREDDTLPERLLTEPLKGGASKGHFVSRDELNQMLDEYYEARGWDVKTGAPSREKLEELGLGYVADQMSV